MNCPEVEEISVATPNSTSVSLPLSGRDSMDSPGDSSRLRRSVWEQEILTPDQFVHPARESLAAWTGERRLLLAVLEEAVHTYRKYCQVCTRREKQLFGEVQEWFLSQDTHWLYAFESICSYLGFDPDSIRKDLQRGHAQAVSPTLPSGTLREEPTMRDAPG
jgi:hypothetical protein